MDYAFTAALLDDPQVPKIPSLSTNPYPDSAQSVAPHHPNKTSPYAHKPEKSPRGKRRFKDTKNIPDTIDYYHSAKDRIIGAPYKDIETNLDFLIV